MHAFANPFSRGEVILAIISAGLGFAVADFVDRYLATYDPSVAAPPTDRFTGGTNGTLANTLNISSPPSMIRLGAGVGVTALFGLGAYVVKNSLGRSALQGAMVGAGVNLFKLVWNAWVMGNLLKPAAADQATMQKSLGARLYPAEVVAAQNLAASPPAYTSPQGLNRAPQQQHAPAAPPPAQRPHGVGDPGPFATAPAAPPAPQGLARPAAPANTNGSGKLPYNPLMYTLTGS